MLDVGGTPVFVRRWGRDDGRPFLFFHSLGPAASGALIDVGTGPLVAAGYAIAAPDGPGFGQSPPLPPDEYEITRLAERGLALADRLRWDRFVLGGHSWGGSIAVHIAAAAPNRVRALVLADSGHLDYGDDPTADLTSTLDELTEQQAARTHRAPDRAGVARDLELPIDDPVVDSFLEGTIDDGEGGLITRTSPATRAAALYYLARARQSEQWPALAAAKLPVLLLLATEPEIARERNEAAASRFRAAVPQADVRFMEGATHSLVTDLRDGFGTAVVEWLAALD
jgi:lipase